MNPKTVAITATWIAGNMVTQMPMEKAPTVIVRLFGTWLETYPRYKEIAYKQYAWRAFCTWMRDAHSPDGQVMSA